MRIGLVRVTAAPAEGRPSRDPPRPRTAERTNSQPVRSMGGRGIGARQSQAVGGVQGVAQGGQKHNGIHCNRRIDMAPG